MASVLSVHSQSPFKRSFSDNVYVHTISPLTTSSFDSLQDITPNNASTCSLFSVATIESLQHGIWLQGKESLPPFAPTSQLDISLDKEIFVTDSRSLDHFPLKRTGAISRKRPSFSRTELPSEPHLKKRRDSKQITIVPVHEDLSTPSSENIDQCGGDTELLDLYEAIHVPLPEDHTHNIYESEPESDTQDSDDETPAVEATQSLSFRRWMSTLRRRKVGHQDEPITTKPRLSIDVACNNEAPPKRKRSDSVSSSLNYVTAMKTASITIASASIAPRSDCGFHTKFRLGNRESGASEARRSIDNSPVTLGPIIDEGAWLRSIQRRKIVEEIISSEESYIGDLKVLINDYFMILTSVPTLSNHQRASIQHNISQILQLHQELLADLHRVVPNAEYTQSAQQDPYPVTRAKHIRFHSADLTTRFTEHKITRKLRHSLDIGRSPDHRPRALATDTKTAGEIAKIFNKHMRRFFTYEEYGAHWTTMSQDLTSTCKGLQGWFEYERGVEALSKLVSSVNNREVSSKKALSFSDLLIKPIQRVCKYPLLFGDLCRHTPVYDDPEAHAELEKTLFRFQETIREVNKAKDDPKARKLIEISWLLQDRLLFRDQTLSRAVVFRLLGHVLACGVLHVTYQSPERTKGAYMLCCLYKSCLVLATTSRLFTPYDVVATITLANATIEEPDNGRGLQCYTAPHTWKLTFEHGHRLHEIILSACSGPEEEAWKSQLRERIASETTDLTEGHSTTQDMFSSLSLDIKSIGPVFGHADNLVRRMSVHRAATLGAKMNVTQVVIKNTHIQKAIQPTPSFPPTQVSRSQSHMSASHVPILAPRRAERIRLESALEDVWTKDVVPFPGMGSRRENQIRASANSVMRKLSMVSIASNFSRRSPSFSSLSMSRSDESFGSRASKRSQGNLRARSAAERRPAPVVVDFHNAPAAFLPTDFGLGDMGTSSRQRRLGNRAASFQQSTETSMSARPKHMRRFSAQIITLPRTDPSSRIDVRVSTAPNTSSSATAQPTKTRVNFGSLQENEKVAASEARQQEATPKKSSSITSHKRYLKTKSKMFKFWL
ncbi:hypothetical protein BU24DRAFT_152770 [Aaosphaeria arxii CBS 175.79]|uniref:DH domain-containing protein n=1 Tax=Aaosphaeria arxii CBS 175.79 TaxID=1450172 RepID=A0A6A5XY56_9PLEO|nr:uncharacterized protein BU24DRAFT_152770 [Aaosphaeria arxii CBS 175.79]KAF2017570.1 hypothetical protein BU24DRAFT_152770 [Aaosphaeria arxii CBS 175.79]